MRKKNTKIEIPQHFSKRIQKIFIPKFRNIFPKNPGDNFDYILRDEPGFMEIHEELKQVVVIKENQNRKCDYYRDTQVYRVMQ